MTLEHGNNCCFYKLIYDENARKLFVSWALPVPCSPCVLTRLAVADIQWRLQESLGQVVAREGHLGRDEDLTAAARDDEGRGWGQDVGLPGDGYAE